MIIIIIIITDVNWTSEGKYISAMYNQSQGNTQYTILEHKWHTKCTEPVTPKTPRVHERKSEQETNKN